MLVKSIETLPALALSAVLLNFSWPSGLAWRRSVSPAFFGTDVDGFGFTGCDFGVTGVARFDFEAPTRGFWVLDVAGVLDVLRLRSGVEGGVLGAGVAVVVLDVVGITALGGLDAEVAVRLDEPPQPASASRPTINVGAESLRDERDFALGAVCEVIDVIFH